MALTSKEINGESWFVIEQVDRMRPFLMSLVSPSNHWMFISSNGGLTAGRKNAEFPLFPYYTDDKLTDFAHTTGSCTIIRVNEGAKPGVWEPFSLFERNRTGLKRNLYKNRFSNKVLFEEENAAAGLTFRYEWNTGHRFGFIRKAELINTSKNPVSVYLVDGIQNVMPYGVGSSLQNGTSNLVDAYKRSECLEGSNLGIFALSAIIVDRAEPSEALMANAVYGVGLKTEAVLLSSRQLDAVRNGATARHENDVKGERGAYFQAATLTLQPGERRSWMQAANLALDHARMAELDSWLKSPAAHAAVLQDDIDAGTRELIHLVAESDGVMLTGDPLKDVRHYNNTLFNVMRGGIFDSDYRVDRADFVQYISRASKAVYARHASLLNGLPETLDHMKLQALAAGIPDADLQRLTGEYLPLRFSRRHGDPSRPWNRFSINTLDEKTGRKLLDYEGNWRDIFQNWEALAHSYPHFIEGMISRFLNASTFEGYNPYRIMKGGFDWETIEHDNPWSYIGYWGDHQIIYLLKFLEFYAEADPAGFQAMMGRTGYVYANVPYRIKPYADIVRNPKDTVEFDEEADREIRHRMEKDGADGALLRDRKGEIHRVSFMEKILASVLGKLSNFIPEAGIWLNTQRPEWNDANNALVGNGVSMVTLYYLRRYLSFFARVLPESARQEFSVSTELAAFFQQIDASFASLQPGADGRYSEAGRRSAADQLGMAGGDFRTQVYRSGFSGERARISAGTLRAFIERAGSVIDHSIRVNRRSDGLYHAYNLIRFTPGGIAVRHLYEMLEGQVAVLSSGSLNAEAAADLLDAMRGSALYRADQNSYLLYPDRELPGFMKKNFIPEPLVQSSDLLKQLLHDGNTAIVVRDVNGAVHFSGQFKNAADLTAALSSLQGTPYEAAARTGEAGVLDIFEQVFNHEAFTGRSGTFFAYEGLGSIYWHMVSKLHLALTEVYVHAAHSGASAAVLKRLQGHFDEIGAGIGVKKDPAVYGAFPVDPYSHTPKHKGAQQPGMTGQVKEDLLVRRSELGLTLQNGTLAFSPGLLTADAFLSRPAVFEIPSATGPAVRIDLAAGSLAFTCCRVPVVYTIGRDAATTVVLKDGTSVTGPGTALDRETTARLFRRDGSVDRILVTLTPEQLRAPANL